MANDKKKCTYIGGQAVIEGVMMRGKKAMATAVRDPEGNIQIESERFSNKKRNKFLRAPFVRGVVNFVSSLIDGNKILMRSAEVQETEEPTTTKAEKWLKEEKKVNVDGIINTIALIVGVILAIGLFVVLPQFLTGLTGFEKTGKEGLYFNLIEGGIRMLIFVIYMIAITIMPTMRRVFMYHGAEHKTITAYESGLDLTVENVKKCRRVHDRCGTTFMFLVMLISILVFSLANSLIGERLYTDNDKLNRVIRVLLKLALLPFVAGISYEVLKLLAKTQNPVFILVKWPGLLLQLLTTKEPTDDMIECAIAAFNKVLKMDHDPLEPETVFITSCKMGDLLKNTKKRFANLNIEEDEAEWIFALKLSIPKGSVAATEKLLTASAVKEIVKIADERLTGRPLWYIIGDADFYGYTIKVDERVLIPRPETEELADKVIKTAEDGYKILDLCTGSGAISIAVYKELQKRGKTVKITASDISVDALELAKENAELNGADIKFVQSDMFEKITGRYDIIVTNPPYIPTKDIATLQREVKDFEPKTALDGGEDGLDFYRIIAENARKHLSKGGIIMCEVGIGEAEEVVKLFKYCDYTMIIKDMAGIDRFVEIFY